MMAMNWPKHVVLYLIYLLTAIGLLPGGSTHLHTNNTYNNTTILEECGPCPVLASITLAFALQPRKGKSTEKPQSG